MVRKQVEGGVSIAVFEQILKGNPGQPSSKLPVDLHHPTPGCQCFHWLTLVLQYDGLQEKYLPFRLMHLVSYDFPSTLRPRSSIKNTCSKNESKAVSTETC